MEDKYYLKNYTEVLVADAIKKVWADMDNICKCDRCYYDTLALSLNHLPSKYVVTPVGEVYTKANHLFSQTQVDVMSEVMKASMKVNQNYSHSLEEVKNN